MEVKQTRLFATLIFIAVGVFFPNPASAFYTYRQGENGFEASGFIRAIGWYQINPDIEGFYSHDVDFSGGAIARLLLDGWAGQHISFSFNALQMYQATSYKLGDFGGQSDVNRSPALESRQINSDKTEARIVADWANVRFSWDMFDLTIGRQPINLATSYFFTPNDFFAPFSAQTYYRVYKSGVDAVRLETRLGDLTQLTVVGVLGYAPDPNAPSGWSDRFDRDQSSSIARLTTSRFGYELGLIGGRAYGYRVLGGSFSGELVKTVSLRVEGHYSFPKYDNEEYVPEISVELEKKALADLSLWATYFYHGSGADNPLKYDRIRSGQYLGRDYAALGVGYQSSPLLYWEILSMINLSDQSYLVTYNFTYSVSDETEFSGGMFIPAGKTYENPPAYSEFGVYPTSIYFEVRSYF